MDEYISKHEAYTMMKDLEAAYIYPPVKEAYATAARRIDQMKVADVQPINPLVKVEERVPNVSGNYLCYLSDGEFEVLYFDREIEDDEYNNDYPFGIWNTYPSEDGGECREWIEVLEATHWQPLPEPPKDGDTE
jgi:hypothetical protein